MSMNSNSTSTHPTIINLSELDNPQDTVVDANYEIKIETILGKMMYNFHLAAWLFPSKTATPIEHDAIRGYFTNYGSVLPCPNCRAHYAKYIEEHPVDTKNLFKWSVDLHNDINRIQNKPTVTENEAMVSLIRSVASNTEEIDRLLAAASNSNQIGNMEEKNGGEEGGGSDDQLSTTTTVLILFVTVVSLSALMYFAWKHHTKQEVVDTKE